MATHTDSQGIRLVRRLVGVNVGLIALQAVSAGFLLSGYARARNIHTTVAFVLQVGALIQAVAAIVLWRRHRVPAWVAGVSTLLFVVGFLQIGFGFRKWYWLHVPVGVGLFGALNRQMNRLDTLLRSTS